MAELPLKGVRVIDLCVVWAGPFATMLLGDLGAEVIKPENPFVFQPMTRGAMARPPRQLLMAVAAWSGGLPDNDPGRHPWNYNPTFVSVYRNKKSFTVDLRRPEGMDVLRRLVEVSDVVVENNAVDTLSKLGITYDWLKGIKDDIIVVRVPAYGLSGPYAEARALGVHLESVMGHTLLRGYRDLDPSNNTAIFSGDYMSGTQGALAVMMALWQRRKTGKGQLIEVAQAENASPMFAQAFMDYALNGNVQSANGNRSVYEIAPCGVYPCVSPGEADTADDRWIAITVTNDEEWVALRGVMGEPDWATAPDLETSAGRVANQDMLDEKLAAWTKDQDDYELFHRLQAAGVPAAPVLEASRVLDDAHVQARAMYQEQKVFDDIGVHKYMAPFYRFPETPVTVYQPPVAFGEHNDYVYKELLKVSDEQFEALQAGGHISIEYDESVP
ncbi:MAG TPA: CoA transferase [Dehalococcoidia bacterium]|nr:CoA transferase [Dehalococcoidia bacterium]